MKAVPAIRQVEMLSRSLRSLPPKTEFLILAGFTALLGYSVWVFRLFPTHDWWNSYGIFRYVISSLLDGTIPYWSPATVCGSPLFYTFIQLGMLDPAFLAAVAAGKLLSLNILTICFTWFVLRMVPFIFGMFWLLKQHTRHSVVSLAVTLPLSLTIFLCLLRDSSEFCAYWPLLLAAFSHFLRQRRRGRTAWPAFYASIALFGISLLLYNPAYTLVFVGALAALTAALARARFLSALRLLARFPPKHWALGAVLGAALVGPAAATLHAQDRGNHFVYVRAHQAFHAGLPLSSLAGEPVEYFQVDPSLSPRRQLGEAITCAFPFYYTLPRRMEGMVYFGFLPFLGAWAGAVFFRRRVFWVYVSASVFCAFFMSPLADSFIRFFGPVLPFLRILNQRHLLYPALLVPAAVAGGMGLTLLVERRLMARVAPGLVPWKVALAGAAFLAGVLAAAWLNWPRKYEVVFQELYQGQAKWLHLLFLGTGVGVAAGVRSSLRRKNRYRLHLAFLALVGFVDLAFLCPDIVAGRRLAADNDEKNPLFRFRRNEGLLAQSRWVRNPQPLSYIPFRSPLLPRMFGSHVTSIASLAGIPSALPAYWHCDVMYSTERYYELSSQLDENRLKPLLAITAPILRTCGRWRVLRAGEDAVAVLKEMPAEECLRTALLEAPDAPKGREADPLTARAFSGPAVARRNLFFPTIPEVKDRALPGWATAVPPRPSEWGILDSFMMDLGKSAYPPFFDKRMDLSAARVGESSQGVYHSRVARMEFDPPELRPGPDGRAQELPLFFPEFSFAIDVRGKLHYVSNDGKAVLTHAPGKGLLLEWSGSEEPPFPKGVFFQHLRRPLPSDPEVVAYGPNRIEARVQREQPAVVLFSDLYDKNWHVDLDGRPAPLWVANHAFKAVQIPAGPQPHTVVFEYRVPWLARSLRLYALAAAGSVWLAAWVCLKGCFFGV